ncbi:Potassium channel AKT1 [Zea mays]|uniref:Potassium channel AKT1 n=1 Tax=Zea mays TaxID=4577 RepID=A0A3L6FUL0_MAIZE|nr:Potassium channel AKT1 [Zea mays]
MAPASSPVAGSSTRSVASATSSGYDALSPSDPASRRRGHNQAWPGRDNQVQPSQRPGRSEGVRGGGTRARTLGSRPAGEAERRRAAKAKGHEVLGFGRGQLLKQQKDNNVMVGVLKEFGNMLAYGRLDLSITLYFTINKGDDFMLHQLLKCGLDPNESDNDGHTTLHIAASSEDEQCAMTVSDSPILVGDMHTDGDILLKSELIDPSSRSLHQTFSFGQERKP